MVVFEGGEYSVNEINAFTNYSAVEIKQQYDFHEFFPKGVTGYLKTGSRNGMFTFSVSQAEYDKAEPGATLGTVNFTVKYYMYEYEVVGGGKAGKLLTAAEYTGTFALVKYKPPPLEMSIYPSSLITSGWMGHSIEYHFMDEHPHKVVKETVVSSSPLITIKKENGYWMMYTDGDLSKVKGGGLIGKVTVTVTLSDGSSFTKTCEVRKASGPTYYTLNYTALNNKYPGGVPTGATFHMNDYITTDAVFGTFEEGTRYTVIKGGVVIDQYGNFRAYAPGDVQILVWNHYNTVSANFNFTVVGESVKRASLTPKQKAIHVGDSFVIVVNNLDSYDWVPIISCQGNAIYTNLDNMTEQIPLGDAKAEAVMKNGRWTGEIKVTATKAGRVTVDLFVDSRNLMCEVYIVEKGQPLPTTFAPNGTDEDGAWPNYRPMGGHGILQVDDTGRTFITFDPVNDFTFDENGNPILNDTSITLEIGLDGRMLTYNMIGLDMGLFYSEEDGIHMKVLSGPNGELQPATAKNDGNLGVYLLLVVVACIGVFALLARRRRGGKAA
ncbi:hypothetical protein LJC55_02485 [Eubacteriales bacterium OttesenSCG-928-N14]|nr:hypothetical protein [Eubacteriales bacterium OttesenSCG-928-N14]